MLLRMYGGGGVSFENWNGCRSSISLWTKRHYDRLQEKDHSPETLAGGGGGGYCILELPLQNEAVGLLR